MNETTQVGSGIILTEPPHLTAVPDLPEVDSAPTTDEPVPVITTLRAEGEPAAPPEVVDGDLVSQLREEMRAAVADIEWRLAQQYELKLREATGAPMVDHLYVEDINDGVHRMTGYTVTNNTPAGGITWASLHIVFKGVDYTIADGNTTNKYAWFVKPGSGTTATLVTGNTFPTLGPEDALIFVNNAGVARSVLEESVPSAVMPGSISQASIDAGFATLLSTMQSDLLNAQATADGSVVSYFQDNPPWPTGDTTQSPSKVGDIWYDSNDGGAFRWSGASGTPANTWVRIADTDTSALAARVNTRITTFVAPSTAPPVATGNSPFVDGDLWMVTDMDNKFRRRLGANWIDLALGDNALAGISGAKVGTGISGTNITTGTVGAARVGAGVNGAVLTTGTGTVGGAQIASGGVQPRTINAAFHLLY